MSQSGSFWRKDDWGERGKKWKWQLNTPSRWLRRTPRPDYNPASRRLEIDREFNLHFHTLIYQTQNAGAGPFATAPRHGAADWSLHNLAQNKFCPIHLQSGDESFCELPLFSTGVFSFFSSLSLSPTPPTSQPPLTPATPPLHFFLSPICLTQYLPLLTFSPHPPPQFPTFGCFAKIITMSTQIVMKITHNRLIIRITMYSLLCYFSIKTHKPLHKKSSWFQAYAIRIIH